MSAPPAWLITVEPPVSCERSIAAVEPEIVPVLVMPPTIGLADWTPMPIPLAGGGDRAAVDDAAGDRAADDEVREDAYVNAGGITAGRINGDQAAIGDPAGDCATEDLNAISESRAAPFGWCRYWRCRRRRCLR